MVWGNHSPPSEASLHLIIGSRASYLNKWLTGSTRSAVRIALRSMKLSVRATMGRQPTSKARRASVGASSLPSQNVSHPDHLLRLGSRKSDGCRQDDIAGHCGQAGS